MTLSTQVSEVCCSYWNLYLTLCRNVLKFYFDTLFRMKMICLVSFDLCSNGLIDGVSIMSIEGLECVDKWGLNVMKKLKDMYVFQIYHRLNRFPGRESTVTVKRKRVLYFSTFLKRRVCSNYCKQGWVNLEDYVELHSSLWAFYLHMYDQIYYML